MIITICQQCGKEFEARPYFVRIGTKKYCSRKCMGEYYSAHNVGENSPRWSGGNKKFICEQCGKIFFDVPARASRRKHCSKKCMDDSRRTIKPRNCLSCGKKFMPKNRKASSKYCSQDCYLGTLSGEGNPNWNGGPIDCTCRFCGKSFTACQAEEGRRIYCSKKCRARAEMNRIHITCPACGKAFQATPSQLKDGRRFCSYSCFRSHRPTSIELAIQKKLDEIGIEYIPEYGIGRWSIDLFVPSINLAIECDGDYWHRSKNSKDRDRRKNDFLKKRNIKVLRFTEKQIRGDIDKCITVIIEHINTPCGN